MKQTIDNIIEQNCNKLLTCKSLNYIKVNIDKF